MSIDNTPEKEGDTSVSKNHVGDEEEVSSNNFGKTLDIKKYTDKYVFT